MVYYSNKLAVLPPNDVGMLADMAKQALNIAHQDARNYGELLSCFKGVAFMGTPHAGSDVAFWTSYAARLLHSISLGTRTNKNLLDVLKRDSKFLGRLSRQFEVQNNLLEILTFYETKKPPMLNICVKFFIS